MARKTKRKKGRIKWWITIFIISCLAVLGYIGWLQYRTELNTQKRHEMLESIPEGFSSIGLDVSHHQGKIDWSEVFDRYDLDSVIQFVYCKATEGADHVDTRWESNRSQLIQLQIPNGAYHFFSLTSDPIEQAENFLTHWKKTDGDLPPVLDVETEGIPDSDLIGRMTMWLDHVELRTGMRPVIYTSLHFYETKFKSDFRDHKFWIAAYSRQPQLEDPRIIHWQYTEKGQVPGIKGNVDLNVSKITYF